MLHNIPFFHSKSLIPILLTLFLAVGGILRFYDINWGAPFYFHPDERNIASSVSQVSFSDMNPHFFAYGSLPMYVIFLHSLLGKIFTACSTDIFTCTVSFESALLIGRIISAFFSTLLILITYFIGKKILNSQLGIIASCFVTFSTGLIQYAHFMTFEMWTTFFSALLLLTALSYIKTPSKINFYSLMLVSGILISVKVSNLVLLLVPALCLLVIFFKEKKSGVSIFIPLKKLLFRSTFFGILITGIFFLTNPYSLLAHKDFRSSIDYESKVALGTLDVFYTGEFYNTIPILFHGVKVFPFLLNPLIFILAVIGLCYTFFLAVKNKSIPLLFLLVLFCLLFLSQAFFYVKWIRYMVPTLPFIYLMISLMFVSLIQKLEHRQVYLLTTKILLVGSVLVSIVFSFSFIMTVFVEQDTRIAARNFAVKRIPGNARILSEVYDMGIVPFNDTYTNIKLFNFYDLDTQDFAKDELDIALTEADYFILPSQRLLATRLENAEKFPIGSGFYESVLKNNARFSKVYETPCSLFCQITYLGDPIRRFEGTANVFDRPHVMILKVNE